MPLLATKFNETHGQFSPDGRLIAYTSDESVESEVYVMGAAGQGSTRVSTSGGSFARWRRDGRELYYRSLDGNLMAVSVSIGADGVKYGTPAALVRLVPPLGTYAYPYDVSPDGQKILALTPRGNGSSIAPLSVIVNWDSALKR